MSPGKPLRYAVIWGVLFCAPAMTAADRADERRPNFVFILTDDQRHDTIAAAGNPNIHTPALDKLCAQGLRFANAFVTTSLCSPSRASCLTGRYASANGVVGLGGRLGPAEKTVAALLKETGYRTAVAGKWHLANRPEELGFERAVTFVSNSTYYGRAVTQGQRTIKVPEHVDRYCAGRAIEIMRQWADQPFFLWYCTQLPHMDNQHRWNARPNSLNEYDPASLPVPSTLHSELGGKPAYLQTARSRTRARDEYGYQDPEALREHIRDYYAVISDVDEFIGQVLDAVDGLGIRERTYIIFMGDNGWFLGEHGLTSKVLAYEASIRVPLVISGPAVRQDATDEHLVLSVDIAPTILEWAGIAPPETMHGTSIVPLLRGSTADWRSSFLYEVPKSELGVWPLLAVRTERYKYIRTLDPRSPERTAFEELYDLQRDPQETTNLINRPEQAQTRHELVRLMDQHRREASDTFGPAAASGGPE